MAAPNIVNVSIITGKTAGQAITTTATAIVSNSAASGKVFKINALYVSNITTLSGSVTIDVFRGSTPYRLANNIAVPATASLDIITKSIYLEEGDSIRLTASNNSYLEAVCSYEEIS